MDHTIVHFEIPANNPEKLSAFYKDLFGWKIEKTKMGPTNLAAEAEYWVIEKKRHERAPEQTAE